jgi:prepilin-type N-terminal cleavage/methylation domain-containing protein
MERKAATTISAAGNRDAMHHTRERGFTLLELMMVVLVLALVLAVTYPSLSRGSTALHLRTTGRDILNTLRYAREKAVTEQTGMMVTVDKGYQKLTLTDAFGEGGREYYLPQDVKIQRLALSGTEISDGLLVIRFLPNGSSDSADILIVSSSGSGLRIISDPITGGARIQTASGGLTP